MNSRAFGFLVATFVFALIAGADPISVITVGPGSTIIDDSGIHPVATSSYSGAIEEWVVSDTTNPLDPGGLDFIFQVTDFSGSIKSFGMTSCCFTVFNAGITSGYGSGTETPSSIGASGPGTLPEFIFGSGMSVGTSVDLIDQTNTGYYKSAYFQINGVTEGGAVGPLPEPKAIGLVLGGFFGLGLLLTHRFRTKEAGR
jgi:hypothetical protein